ncbi:hypothetical protein Tco_1214986 [Tanacetum coccineum]
MILKQLKKANASLTQELKECKTNLDESSRALGEATSSRDSSLIALQTKQTELEKYTALNDLTSDYKILQTKLNDTLGLLAIKDIDIKEGLKTKTNEISIVKQKHDELVKKSLLNRSQFEGQLKEKTKVISDLKVKEGKDIDTMIEMDKQIKFLNEILYKRNQSITGTIHMLHPTMRNIPIDTSDPATRFAHDEGRDSDSCKGGVKYTGTLMHNTSVSRPQLRYLNDVNARTKNPKVVPISANKPKRKANKSVATPHKKTVASDTTIQKPKSYFKELYENTNKAWKWWIAKKCPSEYKWTQTTPLNPRSCLRWKPTGRIFSNVRLRWIPTGKLLNSCTGKVDSEPAHGSIVDIPHIHACKQTLGLSAGTSFNGQKQQRIDLNADALHNEKQENLRVCSSSLGRQCQMASAENNTSGPVPQSLNDVCSHQFRPLKFKAGSKSCSLSKQDSYITTRVGITIPPSHSNAEDNSHKVVRLGINPMIQPEPEDLPKDNPKLEIAVLRSNGDHDACVSRYLKDVHARTKKPNVVPISASKPKRKANKSVATPHRKTVASDTTIQKSKSYYKKLYENTNQEWKWWIAKRCPSVYTWTQKPLRTKKIWMPKIRKDDESTSISPTIDIVSRITNVLKISNSLGSNLSNVPSSSNSLADCTTHPIHC